MVGTCSPTYRTLRKQWINVRYLRDEFTGLDQLEDIRLSRSRTVNLVEYRLRSMLVNTLRKLQLRELKDGNALSKCINVLTIWNKIRSVYLDKVLHADCIQTENVDGLRFLKTNCVLLTALCE